MERLKRNWLLRAVVFITGIFSIRLVSAMLHYTTLEKLYKPRDFRKTSHLDISQDIIDRLPRYCQTIFGRKMDPINLIFVGTEAGLKRAFEKIGWDGAHPSTPLHIGFGFASSFFNRTYRHGPFMPLYISVGLQDLSFQKVQSAGYGRRHHIRIWRTRHVLPDNNRVWVAAATFEKGFKAGSKPPFFYHHKEAKIDIERDYITTALVENGNLIAGKTQINQANTRINPHRDPNGDDYYTDGEATIIEIV
jgi:hypothetical protein